MMEVNPKNCRCEAIATEHGPRLLAAAEKKEDEEKPWHFLLWFFFSYLSHMTAVLLSAVKVFRNLCLSDASPKHILSEM